MLTGYWAGRSESANKRIFKSNRILTKFISEWQILLMIFENYFLPLRTSQLTETMFLSRIFGKYSVTSRDSLDSCDSCDLHLASIV